MKRTLAFRKKTGSRREVYHRILNPPALVDCTRTRLSAIGVGRHGRRCCLLKGAAVHRNRPLRFEFGDAVPMCCVRCRCQHHRWLPSRQSIRLISHFFSDGTDVPGIASEAGATDDTTGGLAAVARHEAPVADVVTRRRRRWFRFRFRLAWVCAVRARNDFGVFAHGAPGPSIL